MKYLQIFIVFILTSSLIAVSSNNKDAKKMAIVDFRQHFSENAYRGHQLDKSKVEQFTSQQCIDLLGDDGRFIDLKDIQKRIEEEKMNRSKITSQQDEVSDLGAQVFNRIWRISQTFRGKEYSQYKKDDTYLKLLKAINNYGNIELERGSIRAGRFHESCFAIPTAAVNTYFCLFYAMEDIEKGNDSRELALAANQNLLDLSYQSWTQPYRNDETDNNVVSVERFQNHVWWVGGNGLGYRSLLPTAAAMRSVEMMDVLSEVAKGGISWTSQNTYDEAFWTEGFTADGAGWGHGMQCLVWGYPVDGTTAALNLMDYFKGTPWGQNLEEKNTQALLNYYRGSNWYYYKGYTPPCLDRGSMAYSDLRKNNIKTGKMITNTIDSWFSSFSDIEQKELLDLQEDIKDKHITMDNYPNGLYNGTRWFFNNDNLVKKNPDYYTLISMASIRCDGIEMAHTMADKYNFFTCDGMTFFMKEGNEYHQAIGAWNLTAFPGVTSRQVDDDKLVPITNWRGYTSKHNFAATATSGGLNAAAGFIHEKLNASDKKDVNDKTGSDDPNEFIYGVKSYKGYFMFDDYMLALGAGISNLNPDMEGDIWTTIDQTHYNGELQFSDKTEVSDVSGSISRQLNDKEIVWAAQKQGFAYAVLPKHTTGDVFLQAETRKAKWEKINKSNEKIKDLPETEAIFQMHINHGQNIQNGTYAYLVYSGNKKAKNAFENMPLEILENSTSIQAVKWGEDYLGASFYNANEVLNTNTGKISVSAPCALLLEKDGDAWKLTVTDAEMNADLQNIVVKTTLPVKGQHVKVESNWNVITIPMHQGAFCGKPSTISLASI